MQVRLSDIIAQPHLGHFNSTIRHQIRHGGRGGFKSSTHAIKIAYHMITDPSCEVVVIRQDKSDHRKTSFRDLILAIEERLGYKLVAGKNYPEGNTGSLWIKMPKGNMIHFDQMKSVDKLKGYRPSGQGKKIKIVWYFEITEFKDHTYIQQANSGFGRGGDKDYMIYLYEYNDPPKLSHWVYDWVEMMRQRDDVFEHKVNYNDTTTQQQIDFLGEEFIQEAESLKKYDYEQFKNVYLGLPANLQGGVYRNFDREKVLAQPTYQYQDITIGVDFGASDATVFVANGVLPDYQGFEVFKYYKHENGKGSTKNINDYMNDLLQFCAEIYTQHQQPVTVYIDPANKVFIDLIKEATLNTHYSFIFVDKIIKRSSEKQKTSIQERIDITELMMSSGFLTIDPTFKELIKAFEEAEYNANHERADDGRSDINSLDAFEYAWLKDKKLIKELILGA